MFTNSDATLIRSIRGGAIDLPLRYRLQYVRHTANLTQAGFAERIGVSEGYVARLETGRERWSENVADAVAREFPTVWLPLSAASPTLTPKQTPEPTPTPEPKQTLWQRFVAWMSVDWHAWAVTIAVQLIVLAAVVAHAASHHREHLP